MFQLQSQRPITLDTQNMGDQVLNDSQLLVFIAPWWPKIKVLGERAINSLATGMPHATNFW